MVLGVETIFARDQHILDEWWRREIDEDELRERIRFDLDWGYDWQPFYELLVTAASTARPFTALIACRAKTCARSARATGMPRTRLLRSGNGIPSRDRGAVRRVASCAAASAATSARQQLPAGESVTVLQNVDALYWRRRAKTASRWSAVQVTTTWFASSIPRRWKNTKTIVCTWRAGRMRNPRCPDLTPTIYNLIDSLLRFLRHQSLLLAQWHSAEISGRPAARSLRREFRVRLAASVFEIKREGTGRSGAANRVEERGSVYLPQVNAFYVHDFQMMYAAEEAARFLHHACRGLPQYGMVGRVPTLDRDDEFYVRAMEDALAYFGSRVLHPARPNDEGELDELSTAVCKSFLKSALRGEFEEVAERLGYRLGSALYADYLAGKLSRGEIRKLMLIPIDEPGAARALCMKIAAAERFPRKKRPVSAPAAPSHRRAL